MTARALLEAIADELEGRLKDSMPASLRQIRRWKIELRTIAASLAEQPAKVEGDAPKMAVIQHAYITDKGVVLTGIPQQGFDEESDNAHNCDANGCGQVHVIARCNYTDERTPQPPDPAGAAHERVQDLLLLLAEVLPPRPLNCDTDKRTFTLSPLAIEQMHIRFNMLAEALNTPPTAQRHDEGAAVQTFYAEALKQLTAEGARATQTTIRDRAKQLQASHGAGAAVEAVARTVISEATDGWLDCVELTEAGKRLPVGEYEFYTAPPQQRSEQVAGGGGVDALAAVLNLQPFKHRNDSTRLWQMFEDFATADEAVSEALRAKSRDAGARVDDAMVERGLAAAIDASDARLPRYKVVTAILEAALHPDQAKDGAAE